MLGDSYHQPVSVCSKNTVRDRLEAQFHQERCAMQSDSSIGYIVHKTTFSRNQF